MFSLLYPKENVFAEISPQIIANHVNLIMNNFGTYSIYHEGSILLIHFICSGLF